MIGNLKKTNNALYRDILVTFKIMSPLVGVVGLALYFNHFVWNAMKSDLAIAGSILGAALYGCVIIFFRMRNAQLDFRVIERFGREADAGTPMTQLLDEPWIRHRYVRHYLKHIAETGGTLSSQLDQNAIESELQALQEDYNAKLEFPQFLVGFMIAMGLLGTFIGLLETLTGISGMLGNMGTSTASPDEQFKALVVELRKPLAGMGIAFSASMFGLITSLMLAIMMTNLRHLISRTVMCARNVMHDLTEIARKTHPTPQAVVTIGNGGGGGGEVMTRPAPAAPAFEDTPAYRAQDGSMLLASRLDLLTKKLEVLFQSFETSISSTMRLNDLLGFGPRMKETGERTLEELRSITGTSMEQQHLLQQMLDSQAIFTTTLTSILETQRRGQSEFSAAIKVMSERVNAVEEATIGSGRHLWEIKENFAKMGNIYGMMEMLSSSVSHQTLLFEALIGETRSIKQWFGIGGAPATSQE